MIRFIIDLLYYIRGYRIKYFNLNWKHIYIKPKYKRFKDIQDEHTLISKTFWHLIYFFKKELFTNNIKKVSKNVFNKEIYKVKKEYFSNTFIHWEDTVYHEDKLTELLHETLEEEKINW